MVQHVFCKCLLTPSDALGGNKRSSQNRWDVDPMRCGACMTEAPSEEQSFRQGGRKLSLCGQDFLCLTAHFAFSGEVG